MAKRLTRFRRVDRGDADFDGAVIPGGATAGSQGVAVADGDDKAEQGSGKKHVQKTQVKVGQTAPPVGMILADELLNAAFSCRSDGGFASCSA